MTIKHVSVTPTSNADLTDIWPYIYSYTQIQQVPWQQYKHCLTSNILRFQILSNMCFTCNCNKFFLTVNPIDFILELSFEYCK